MNIPPSQSPVQNVDETIDKNFIAAANKSRDKNNCFIRIGTGESHSPHMLAQIRLKHLTVCAPAYAIAGFCADPVPFHRLSVRSGGWIDKISRVIHYQVRVVTIVVSNAPIRRQ